MTGSTSTSIWKNYDNGVRNYCGHTLPEGLSKNAKLWENLLTPTTKEEEHDRPISPAEIVLEKWITQEDSYVCSKAALEVFRQGQELATQRGLILVAPSMNLDVTRKRERLFSLTMCIRPTRRDIGWPVRIRKTMPKERNRTILIRSFCVCGLMSVAIHTTTKCCRKRRETWSLSSQDDTLLCTR